MHDKYKTKMSGKNFDIFISYRRSDGDEIAAKINETLKGNHYRCFFDFESLKDGRFDERIERAIEDAPVFIALLTPHYLERPKEEKEKESEDEEKKNDEEDWVIREIECAIKNNKKIIPIDYNKKFVEYPESLSEEIKKGLGGHNFAVVSSGQQYSRDMDALMEDWIGNTVPKPTQRTQGKANIEVSSDVNCDILKAGEVIATVAKGGYNILKLPQGRHKLICRSNDFLDVQQKIVLEIDQDLADDFIEIELANEVQPLIEEKRRKEEEKKIKQKETGGKNFDIFLCYRRSDGTDKARILNLAFKNAGYRCFLDYNDLEGGVFGKKLENAVLDAPVFVMVLTNDYFARCNQEGDWVRREIELALDNDKIIIPINVDGALNNIPDYLDEEFRNRIGAYSWATLFTGPTFDACFNDFLGKRIKPFLSK